MSIIWGRRFFKGNFSMIPNLFRVAPKNSFWGVGKKFRNVDPFTSTPWSLFSHSVIIVRKKRVENRRFPHVKSSTSIFISLFSDLLWSRKKFANFFLSRKEKKHFWILFKNWVCRLDEFLSCFSIFFSKIFKHVFQF